MEAAFKILQLGGGEDVSEIDPGAEPVKKKNGFSKQSSPSKAFQTILQSQPKTGHHGDVQTQLQTITLLVHRTGCRLSTQTRVDGGAVECLDEKSFHNQKGGDCVFSRCTEFLSIPGGMSSKRNNNKAQ